MFNNFIKKSELHSKSEMFHGDKENISDAFNAETNMVVNSFPRKSPSNTVLQWNENEAISYSSSKNNMLIAHESSKGIKVEYPFYTISGYRQMIRKNINITPSIPSITFNVKEMKRLGREYVLKQVESLQAGIISQKNILYQVTKALICCCISENTRTSVERVECEKLLLLAFHRYTAMNKKIGFLKKDLEKACELKAEKGTVHVSNISLNFRQQFWHESYNEELYVWIVCLLSHEETVLATEAKPLEKNTTLTFQGEFPFQNLLNDFTINLQVFSLTLKKGRSTSRHYLKKVFPGMSVFSRSLQSNYEIMNSPILAKQSIFKSTDFQLKSSHSINLHDLKSSIFWCEVPEVQIQMTLNWNVESKVEASGFVTVGEDNGEHCIWERRWCFLEKCALKYWNYPADQENMLPLRKLDLRLCTCTQVEPLAATICSRPRTFGLEFVKDQEGSEMASTINSGKHLKYLFSTDTKEDLHLWCQVLTKNLELLRKWNKI